MKHRFLFSISSLLLLLATGCATTNLQDEDERAAFSRTEQVGERIAGDLKKSNPSATIIVTSFTTANDLSQTDGFGRIAAEQIAGCLSHQGLRVVELKLRYEPVAKKGATRTPEVAVSEAAAAEYALTRDLKKLAREINADFVVTGVYSYGKYNTIVALKAIDRQGVIRHAYNYTVPATVRFDWDAATLNKGQ